MQQNAPPKSAASVNAGSKPLPPGWERVDEPDGDGMFFVYNTNDESESFWEQVDKRTGKVTYTRGTSGDNLVLDELPNGIASSLQEDCQNDE